MVPFTELGTVRRSRFKRVDIKGSVFNILSSRMMTLRHPSGTDL